VDSFRAYLEGFRGFTGMDVRDGFMIAVGGPGAHHEMHNRVHFWAGGQFEVDGKTVVGSMVPITSPNDPVFFLHHGFVDKIWADWGALHDNAYEPITGGPSGMNRDDKMAPFDETTARNTPGQVLTPRDLGFRYDNGPW
jgi:tyrosinase